MHLLHVASIFCFNPRTTQGATFWVVPCIVIMLVSIHAPTQGATLGILQTIAVVPFQSTRPHRVRPLKILFSIVGYTLFQSTHPHRVRHACKGSILFPYLCFNPRTHTGCDVSLAAPQFLNRRFQSTHPHGVRLAESCVCHHQQGFQSTHPHGVRPARRIDARGKGRFNPRTHTGCDQRAHRKTIAPIIVSIHAPTRGATYVYL